ncbi:YdcF family protein [Micropruina sp.]|uniref:YdcF family protein n=1 Tax=Micropruina sp. TaxID=2737536 RepID=UPI0039E3EB53
MIELPSGLVLLLVALVVCLMRDPRTMRSALLLLAVLMNALLTVIGTIVGSVERSWDSTVAAQVLLVLLVLMLGTVLALAGFLIAAGITLIRREGLAISRLLSICLGVGMVGYIVLWCAVLAVNDSRLGLIMLCLGLPLGYLGFGFVAFLIYGALYPVAMTRRGGPVAAVIVLGSGLIHGRVPPLLASRLNRGRQLLDRFPQGRPVLVTSGGKGADEPVPEAVAMADYLIDKGLPADRILLEDRSRNTEQNLANSRDLLRAQGIAGPVAAVTNNFHAFRAALLMRRLHMAGYTVGSPTARYYWASAVIREYIAVLRDHFWLNAILLGLSTLPILVVSFGMLINR